jgi:hypothetical protein
MLARLSPSVDIARACNMVKITAEHVDQMLHPYQGPNGESAGYQAVLIPLRNQLLGDFRQSAVIMVSVSLIMLLMACLNISNLMLVRLLALSHELNMRRAL